MNIFTRFAVRSLRKSPTRTLLTIVGIILSMTLFTAVLEGAYSVVNFVIRYTKATQGTLHGIFPELTGEQEADLREDPAVEETAAFHTLGFALYDPEITTKPYFCIGIPDDHFARMAGFTLMEGRFPETEEELVVPWYMVKDPYRWAVGSRITLEVGTVLENGQKLTLYAENDHKKPKKIVNTEARTYQIVGVYNSGFNHELVPSSSPCNPAFTGGEASGPRTVVFSLKDPRNFFTWIQTQQHSHWWFYNSALLSSYGVTYDSGVNRMVIGFTVILLVIIVSGSVSLIYNAFSTSVAERTRQFGILKSVGASKRQIRRIVLSEALILSFISIPFGLVLGCIGDLWILRFMSRGFESILSNQHVVGVTIHLELSAPILVGSAVLGLLTTLISAWIPAIRANRIQPIEAIRQSTDVKVRKREVKTSRLTEKLFGTEGVLAAKYFKRNRKRYRAVIVSLSLSVLLFVSAFSFIRYLTGNLEDLTSHLSKADILVTENLSEKTDPDSLLTRLSKAEHVTDSAYYVAEHSTSLRTGHNMVFSGDAAFKPIDQYEDYPLGMGLNAIFSGGVNGRVNRLGAQEAIAPVELVFLSDPEFRSLLKKNRLAENEYFDPSSPKGVLCNRGFSYDSASGETTLSPYEMIRPDSVPVDGYMVLDYRLDDYLEVGREDGDGGPVKLYYPFDELVDMVQISIPLLDQEKILRIPESESSYRVDLCIGGTVSENHFCVPNNTPCLYYPYSMLDVLIPENIRERTKSFSQLTYGFRSILHAESFEAMSKIVNEQKWNFIMEDAAESYETERSLIFIASVFAYTFIGLISLIAIVNVFNTMSTNIALRHREIAMLKSVGLSEKGFRKMMNYECLIYGFRSLLFGLPSGALMTYAIWLISRSAIHRSFRIPWEGIVIPIAAVFLIVFTAMLYSVRKVRRDNVIDALKNEAT